MKLYMEIMKNTKIYIEILKNYVKNFEKNYFHQGKNR